MICVASAVLAVFFEDDIGMILSLIGSLFCCPIALTFPSLLHLKILAKSKAEKMGDYFFIVISLIFLVLSTYVSIKQFVEKYKDLN